MSTNPTITIGVNVGAPSVAGLVPLTVSNLTSSLALALGYATSVVTELGTLNTTCTSQATTITALQIVNNTLNTGITNENSLVATGFVQCGSIQATGTLLTGLLVVGNTITVTMTNDLASMMTNLGSLNTNLVNASAAGGTNLTNLTTAISDVGIISNANGTIAAGIALPLANVGSIETVLGTATSISQGNMVVQYGSGSVTNISTLNGALLAVLNFSSAQSLLPP